MNETDFRFISQQRRNRLSHHQAFYVALLQSVQIARLLQKSASISFHAQKSSSYICGQCIVSSSGFIHLIRSVKRSFSLNFLFWQSIKGFFFFFILPTILDQRISLYAAEWMAMDKKAGKKVDLPNGCIFSGSRKTQGPIIARKVSSITLSFCATRKGEVIIVDEAKVPEQKKSSKKEE